MAGGAALAELVAVDLSGLDARLAGVEVVLASDVDNPLLGPQGTAAVFGPQKGADADDVAALERGLARLAHLIDAHPLARREGGVEHVRHPAQVLVPDVRGVGQVDVGLHVPADEQLVAAQLVRLDAGLLSAGSQLDGAGGRGRGGVGGHGASLVHVPVVPGYR